jgi:hypothetical protein
MVRREMAQRGFSHVQTLLHFDQSMCLLSPGRTTLLPSDCKAWWKFPQLARYASWVEALLGEALPDEALSLVSLEFRHERAGCVDEEVYRLHADGSYLRSIFTFCGAATIYREGKEERPVPEGRTLLMTAMDRARAMRIPCTLHRRPGPGPQRQVIVCSFEPRHERPRTIGVHRIVADRLLASNP